MFWSAVKKLLLLGICCSIAACAACQEGVAHDQSGLCVIDFNMPPPFLGFEYWSQVGIALGTLASGLIIAAGMLAARDD
jgi:hypothetical protein